MAVRYTLETDGTFVIDDYNKAKLFCSFFPGIAGTRGIPCWGFYLNRGQGLAGFGFGNKDGAMQEFVPADKAPWYTAWRGFRTLLKVGPARHPEYYEPFRSGNEHDWQVRPKMRITPAELVLEEINLQLGLKVSVTYFTLPQEQVGGLFRKLELVNLRRKKLRLELVDGLAVVLPAGFSNFHAKNMGATIRAWMKTALHTGVPYYKLNYLPEDVPELLPVDHGHFCYGYRIEGGAVRQLQPIYDPELVFGPGADYQPVAFRDNSFRYRVDQAKDNHLPAALHYLQLTLEPGATTELYELYGAVPGGEAQLSEVINQITPDYYEERRRLNRQLISEITDYALTCSGEPRFDSYVRQCFLDNAIRGGVPVTLSDRHTDAAKVFWLYSRKHGDLERDYNDFYLSPSYYSQGNGNFRDICQNRRNDLWFNPDLRDAALRYFWNLIQLDGYNPLVVQGAAYCWEEPERLDAVLPESLPAAAARQIKDLVSGEFTPGELWRLMADDLKLSADVVRPLFEAVISASRQVEKAQPGEGYWIDHWIYLLDLLESFLSIYPDAAVQAGLRRNDYTFYDNWNVLAPLQERFTLRDGVVRLKDTVRLDPEKQRLIRSRNHWPHTVRVNQGKGEIYRTNLLVKMLVLSLNKLSSFDPMATGLEMDAGRPGWCDAVNGLPGICGASVGEVFALKRLLDQIARFAGWLTPDESITVPVEVKQFFTAWLGCWDTLPQSAAECLRLWERAHQVREEYLQRVRLGLDGQAAEITPSELKQFGSKARSLVEQAIGKAGEAPAGLYHTYFYYQVSRWQQWEDPAPTGGGEQRAGLFVRPLEFEQCRLPYFLEGQVHALRNAADQQQAGGLYQTVRESSLFDWKLGMYKVCADLSKAPDELGRIRVFPRGWLENESIFLHMEYKYLLEIFRSGLFTEFYAEFSKLLVCFAEPEFYGRSPLENTSFIVSSAYPRDELHGNGFVARLSGSTAELLQIWLGMSFGLQPFRLNRQNQLELSFAPVLIGDLFSKAPQEIEILWFNGQKRHYHLPADSYGVKFLNRTLIVYYNPKRKPTFGAGAAKIQQIDLTFWDGRRLKITQPVIGGATAEQVRQGLVERINLLLE